MLPATREAEVIWSRVESERRDRGAMVTQTMSQVSRVSGSPGVTCVTCLYNVELIWGLRRPAAALLTLWFVSSIGSRMVNIVNSSHSFVTFYPSLVMIRGARADTQRAEKADFITFSFKLIWNNIKQCQWECSSKVSQQTPQTVATLCGAWGKVINPTSFHYSWCFSTADKMHWFREQIESNLIVGWDVLVDECWLILISFDVMLFLNVSVVWVVEIELKQQEQDKYIPMNWNVS